MTRKRNAEPIKIKINFWSDIRFVAKMDELAIKKGLNRTDIFHIAVKEYMSKFN